MLQAVRRHGDWVCYANHRSKITIPDIETLLDDIAALPRTLKDDRRSLVKVGPLLGRETVAKQPRDKNRRLWSRLLSLVRNGEARQTMLTLLEFQAGGIESVNPFLVLEKKQRGLLVDSWILYEFRAGEPAGIEQLDEIIPSLIISSK